MQPSGRRPFPMRSLLDRTWSRDTRLLQRHEGTHCGGQDHRRPPSGLQLLEVRRRCRSRVEPVACCRTPRKVRSQHSLQDQHLHQLQLASSETRKTTSYEYRDTMTIINDTVWEIGERVLFGQRDSLVISLSARLCFLGKEMFVGLLGYIVLSFYLVCDVVFGGCFLGC
ncbi:hypothetical protein LINPERPRIM_LOCUS16250 [Linum perenne]